MSDSEQVVCAKTTNTTGRPCLRVEPRSSLLKLLAMPLCWSTWQQKTTGPLATISPQLPRPTLGLLLTRNSVVVVVAAAAWGWPWQTR